MEKTRSSRIRILVFGLATAALGLSDGGMASAQTCYNNQDCPNGYSCYRLNGPKWCGVKTSGSAHWTEVNTYNHTKHAAVKTSWDRWNYPPNGPSNTLYIKSDGINHADHDIDWWEGYYGGWWWGQTIARSSGGCYTRKSGLIQLNNSNMPATTYHVLLTAQHEMGHGIGLGHQCTCPQVMNPCLHCGTNVLSWCDGKGAQVLYH